MITTRSPLRISLGGGGTDLPSYYESFGGFFIAAAIDRYVYITLHERFVPRFLLKYSRLEEVDSIDEIEHPLIRECMRLVDSPPGLEIASMADVPAGTGLGSSGSFATALLLALRVLQREPPQPVDLAEQACRVEIDILKEPVGKQDQYIAALGGVREFEISREGQVTSRPLAIGDDVLADLEDNLLLFFTGGTRSASEILKEQDDKSRESDAEMLGNLHLVKELGLKSREALMAGDLGELAALMNVHWEHKKARSASMSSGRINDMYEHARRNGALGGKLIGAGGGGFLMFYSESGSRLRRAMRQKGVRELRFRFDFEGTKLVHS